MFKHLVVYQGISIWRDTDGELWGKSNDKNIKQSRTYESDKNQEAFLEERKDIAFMINYGHMKIESIDGTANETPTDTQTVPPATDTVPADKTQVVATPPATDTIKTVDNTVVKGTTITSK